MARLARFYQEANGQYKRICGCGTEMVDDTTFSEEGKGGYRCPRDGVIILYTINEKGDRLLEPVIEYDDAT